MDQERASVPPRLPEKDLYNQWADTYYRIIIFFFLLGPYIDHQLVGDGEDMSREAKTGILSHVKGGEK